jgi:protein-tyrosine phosphatase/rhodanese-related sulfurtransferase
MAKSILLNNAFENPKNFLQSSSFHPIASAPEDLTLDFCQIKNASHFDKNRLISKTTVFTNVSVSYLGRPVREYDSLSSSSSVNPTSESVSLGVCHQKVPQFSSSILDVPKISVNNCHLELSNGSARSSDQMCHKSCEGQPYESADSVLTPYDLVILMNNQESVLIIDCRSFISFNANHVNGALNVSCSDRITKKRLADGKIRVADVVSGQEGKEIYRRLEAEAEIILYDDSTKEIDSLPETNPLRLLRKCLLKQGKHSKFLQGGLQAFQDSYSFMCSQPDLTAGVPLLFSPTSPEVNCDIDKAIASQILPYLFIGNQRDAANRERLNELGVTHVLNVTSHLPLHFENEGITYKRIPATDSGSQNLKQYFSEAINFIESARKSNGKVLVHCQAGVSRSPTIVAAYIIATSCKTLSEAFTIIKDCRSIVAPNINFMGQLLDLEQQSVQRSGLCPPSEAVHLL